MIRKEEIETRVHEAARILEIEEYLQRKQKELFKTKDYEFDETGNIIPPGGA